MSVTVVGFNVIRIVGLGDDPGVIYNRSNTVTVFMGPDASSATQSDASILDPNASVPVDGTQEVWMTTGINGTSAAVDYIKGAGAYFRGLTSGLGKLSLPAMQSPNYVTGLTGWTIKKDGSAEFNNLTIRGTYFGSNYIIASNGMFFYAGTPAAGNLAASVTPAATTDSFGNVAPAGFTTYQTPLAINSVAVNVNIGAVGWLAWNGLGWGIGAGLDWTVPNGFLEATIAPFRSIAGARATPTTISSDGWAAFGAFNAGFSAGSPTPEQVYLPDGAGGKGSIELRGEIILTGATAANSTMCTAFAGPVQTQAYITPNNLAGYTSPARVITVDTAGNVRCQPTGALNNFVLLDNIRFTLG